LKAGADFVPDPKRNNSDAVSGRLSQMKQITDETPNTVSDRLITIKFDFILRIN
jgi:hypothetical protein